MAIKKRLAHLSFKKSLPPSHLGNVQTSFTLLSVCITFVASLWTSGRADCEVEAGFYEVWLHERWDCATFVVSMSAGRVLKSLMVKRVRKEKDFGTMNRKDFCGLMSFRVHFCCIVANCRWRLLLRITSSEYAPANSYWQTSAAPLQLPDASHPLVLCSVLQRLSAVYVCILLFDKQKSNVIFGYTKTFLYLCSQKYFFSLWN